MREEVWAIVRAAVEDAMGPLVARQRELEARVERAERFAEAVKGTPRPLGAGIPGAPPPPPAAAPQLARQASSAASHLAALGPTMAISSIPVAVGPSVAPSPVFARAPALPRIDVNPARGSLPPTGTYGVTVMESTRPGLDLAAVGTVDISGFDGGRRKRMVARAVVVVMLLIITAVVTMTLLSHS